MSVVSRTNAKWAFSISVLVAAACGGPAPTAERATHAASAAIVAPAWQSGASLPLPMKFPTITQLATGRVLVAGGDVFDAGLWVEYDPLSGAFPTSGAMHRARVRPTATLLQDGRVLVTGGYTTDAPTASAELYDPVARTWTETEPMHQARWKHTATRLASGEVLIVGGAGEGALLASAEVYDPVKGLFVYQGSLDAPCAEHAAVTLSNGDVLITGGTTEQTHATRFLPASAAFSPAGVMSRIRRNHTATLLPDGRVLIVGGDDSLGETATTEVYDPKLASFAPAPKIAVKRSQHQATLLPSGKVLITGGRSAGEPVASSELFDPKVDQFASAVPMAFARAAHAAMLLPTGKVLVTGGLAAGDVSVTSELYDPDDRELSMVLLDVPSRRPSSALLPDGTVLMAGGTPVTAEAWVIDPRGATATSTGPLVRASGNHATALVDDTHVLFAGGTSAGVSIASAESFDIGAGAFASVGSMTSARQRHALTRLPSGEVLATGGLDDRYQTLASAEIYAPATREFRPVGSMHHRRYDHGSMLLPTGQVLVVGGNVDGAAVPIAAELFDPATETFEQLDALTRGGRVRLSSTTTGDPLAAADGTAFRIDIATGALQFFEDQPDHLVALIPRLSGETLVCGSSLCARVDFGVRAAWRPVELGVDVPWSAMLEVPATGVFMIGSTPPKSMGLWYRSALETKPPVIAHVNIDALPGETQLTLTGTGFTTSCPFGKRA